MNKYKVKEDCRIVHAGVEYKESTFVELDPEVALFHAANLELIKAEPLADNPSRKEAGRLHSAESKPAVSKAAIIPTPEEKNAGKP